MNPRITLQNTRLETAGGVRSMSKKIGLFFDEELFDEEARNNTPNRMKRMLKEFKEWRDWDDLEVGKGIFENPSTDIVYVKNLPFTSFCSHHIMQFSGTVSVAYLPGGHVVGLSKIPRTVRKFASRPQLQENLTAQIADYLYKWIPDVKGVAVFISAEHTCMSVRGVRTPGTTDTSALRGEFLENNALKSEVITHLSN